MMLFSEMRINCGLKEIYLNVFFASSVPKGCRAASKAAASNQILFLVGDVLPHKNMFLDTLLVQGLLVYETVVGLKSSYFKPLLTPFGH